MSSRKTNKLNKPPKPHQQNSNNTNRNQHPGSQQPQQKKLASQSSFDAKESTASGLVISVHKAWPDLQLNQSRLFFECTLFLYSVLALFLQYLNLYRTLWWLPKSYWPYSLKYHLINPYLLSCIGLLLGVRVTKCFWDALGERVDYFCKGQGGWQLTCWKIFEFAIVKTPLTTICCTSFMFSFTRIYLEFGTKALGYLFAPLISYICLFHVAFINELTGVLAYILSPVISLFKNAEDKSPESNATLMERFSKLSASVFVGPQNLVDLESVVHLCSDVASRTREEAAILLADFELRCRYCVFTGLLTAYFAIFMPRALLPMRTASGHGQYMLIDDLWVVQLFAIVASTGCSLYITYLFPINYFDLLYRCVVHLGCWESIIVQQSPPTAAATTAAANSCQQQQLLGSQGSRHGKTPPAMQETADEAYNPSSNTPYEDGARVICSNGNCFQAKSHPHFGTVSAEPGNQAHLRLYRLAKDPVRLVTNLCLFQAALVAFQFWLLLLTSDWQQIVTLVLLMFANYLLLAKMFKDRVVIGRIYNPSSEDLQLIKQLREEVEAKRAQRREQQLLLLHKHKQQQQQQLQPQHRR